MNQPKEISDTIARECVDQIFAEKNNGVFDRNVIRRIVENALKEYLIAMLQSNIIELNPEYKGGSDE